MRRKSKFQRVIYSSIKISGFLLRYCLNGILQFSLSDWYFILSLIPKEQGVDELEVTMSQKAGIGLDLSGIDGISVDTTFGTTAKMTMKVKYK